MKSPKEAIYPCNVLVFTRDIVWELLWHQCYKSQDSHADSSLIVDKPVSTSLKSYNRIQNLVLRLNVLYTMSLPRMKSFRSRCWCDRLTLSYFYLFFILIHALILLNLLLHLSEFSFSKDWNCLRLECTVIIERCKTLTPHFLPLIIKNCWHWFKIQLYFPSNEVSNHQCLPKQTRLLSVKKRQYCTP